MTTFAAGCPFKDREWVLEHHAKALAPHFDKLIYLDDGSQSMAGQDIVLSYGAESVYPSIINPGRGPHLRGGDRDEKAVAEAFRSWSHAVLYHDWDWLLMVSSDIVLSQRSITAMKNMAISGGTDDVWGVPVMMAAGLTNCRRWCFDHFRPMYVGELQHASDTEPVDFIGTAMFHRSVWSRIHSAHRHNAHGMKTHLAAFCRAVSGRAQMYVLPRSGWSIHFKNETEPNAVAYHPNMGSAVARIGRVGYNGISQEEFDARAMKLMAQLEEANNDYQGNRSASAAHTPKHIGESV